MVVCAAAGIAPNTATLAAAIKAMAGLRKSSIYTPPDTAVCRCKNRAACRTVAARNPPLTSRFRDVSGTCGALARRRILGLVEQFQDAFDGGGGDDVAEADPRALGGRGRDRIGLVDPADHVAGRVGEQPADVELGHFVVDRRELHRGLDGEGVGPGLVD